MTVNQILETKGTSLFTADPDEVIWKLLRRFQRHRIGALVVLDTKGELLGLLSERDLVTGLLTRGKRLLDLPVREAMSTDVPTCTPGDSIGSVMKTMTDRRTRHLPVVDNGDVCGLISIGDVVKARLDQVELENRVLRDMAARARP
jgi:CBS domain-containing protein